MSRQLSQPGNCCTPCDEIPTTQIPGSQGLSAYQVAVVNGFVGTEAEWLASLDGEDGNDAYTTTTGFIQPAVSATVNPIVANSGIASVGVDVFVEGGGYYRVTAIPDATHITIENLGYTANSAPTANIPNGARIVIAGEKGETGSVDANGALLVANNLSDLSNVASARTNLGAAAVGAALITLTNPGAITFIRINADNTVTALSAANFRIALSLVSGTDIQAFDTFLTSIATLGTAANKMIYTTAANTAAETDLTAFARTILDDADAAAALVTLGRMKARRGLLGSLTAVDMNVSGDTLVPISATRYRVDLIVLDNTSATLAAATAGVFSGAGGIGTIAADQTTAAATAANKYVSFTLSGLATTDILIGANLYFRVGTPAGIAATANIWVFGEDLS